MSGEDSALTWLPVLGGLALKSLFVFLVAGAALLALRRASASARHLVCLLTLAGLLALPLLSLGLPGWRLAVLDSPTAAPVPALPPVTGPMLAPAQANVVPFVSPPSARLVPLLALPEPAPALSRFFPWSVVLPALWLLGALLAGLRPLLGLWGIVRLSRTSAAVLDAPALALAAECASALGLRQAPALRQADAPVPMTWGWRRPVVLLPSHAGGWPEDRLRAVLLHELAHVRRRDWPSHRLADVVCALYWFHPLAWLTARRLRMESEIACDDLVLTSGIAAPDYARHLLDVARALRPVSAAVPQAAIAMARTARIEGRLRMILDTTRPRHAVTRRALLLVLGAGATALIPLAMLRPAARAAAPGSSRHLVTIQVTAATPAVGTSRGIIQLAGVANPGALKWWGVDGTRLPQPVYHPDTAPSAGLADARQRRVLLAFRLLPSAQGVTVKYALTDSLYSSSDGTWPLKMQATSRQTEAQLNARTGGARIVTATFPASVSKTTVRVGTASGPWKVIGTARRDATGRMDGISTQRENTSYIFSPLAETKEGTMLTVSVGTSPLSSVTFRPNKRTGGTSLHVWPGSVDAADDLRIVAVDEQGREILPADIGDSSIGALDQITAHFALPPARIAVIRLESRPFRYVEFKNVALRPAK